MALNFEPKSITALEAQTGDIVRFRSGIRSVKGTVLSREVEGTKVRLEIFEPGYIDRSYTLGASDHIVLVDR